MGIKERREKEKEQLREKILEAASRLFAREGHENLSMRKIAEKIDYSPTTIYLYFKDKNDLLREISESTFSLLLERLRAIRSEDDPPIVRLRKAMREYIEFGLGHPNHYEVTFITPFARELDEGYSYDGSAGQRAFEHMAQLVGESMAAGELKKSDVMVTSQLIWAMGHGITSLLITHCDFPFADKDTLIDSSLEMIFEGIRI